MTDAFAVDIAPSASREDVVRGVLMLAQKWTREHPSIDPEHEVETKPSGWLVVTLKRPPPVPRDIAEELARMGHRVPVMEEVVS